MNYRISVYSLFHNGAIKPIFFFWKNNKVKIDRVTYIWNTFENSRVLKHFSVLSGNLYYHIVYDARESLWYIKDIENIIE